MLKRYIHIILFILLGVSSSFSQTDNVNVLNTVVLEGDTIPAVYLREFKYTSERVFKSNKERRRYGKLKRDVLKVYPYAKLAGQKLAAYEDTLTMLGDAEGRKRRYMKKVEDELNEKFGGELRNLSITQGRILIRLIDRETGDTSYELIKELRGAISAFMWQTVARIFGNNLKTNYDEEGDDKMVEEIIDLVECGVYEVKQF